MQDTQIKTANRGGNHFIQQGKNLFLCELYLNAAEEHLARRLQGYDRGNGELVTILRTEAGIARTGGGELT